MGISLEYDGNILILPSGKRLHNPDATHGAGIFTYMETPKIAQFCR